MKKRYRQSETTGREDRRKSDQRNQDVRGSARVRIPGKSKQKTEVLPSDNPVRLNRFLSGAGVCSRREADSVIASGRVAINGKVVTELGVKVNPGDKVELDGKSVATEKLVYILLNKPSGYITTLSDERDRRIVMDLVKDATTARVYPVGRLDRNTTGVLLLSNDGELANRLMHPSYEITKTYQVEAGANFSDEDLNRLSDGVTLEDGPARAYNVSRMPGTENVIRMSISEGRNRQVRRMIESLGNSVVKLSRKSYAGLTTGGLRPGGWRFISENEVADLRKLVKLKAHGEVQKFKPEKARDHNRLRKRK